MNCVILISRPPASWTSLLGRLPPTLKPRPIANGRFLLERGDSRVYWGVDQAIHDEMEPSEREQLDAIIVPGSDFAVLEYSDIDLMKEIVVAVADDPDIVVDNAHGVVAPGSRFVELLRRFPAWDWRVDPPGAPDSTGPKAEQGESS